MGAIVFEARADDFVFNVVEAQLFAVYGNERSVPHSFLEYVTDDSATEVQLVDAFYRILAANDLQRKRIVGVYPEGQLRLIVHQRLRVGFRQLGQVPVKARVLAQTGVVDVPVNDIRF